MRESPSKDKTGVAKKTRWTGNLFGFGKGGGSGGGSAGSSGNNNNNGATTAANNAMNTTKSITIANEVEEHLFDLDPNERTNAKKSRCTRNSSFSSQDGEGGIVPSPDGDGEGDAEGGTINDPSVPFDEQNDGRSSTVNGRNSKNATKRGGPYNNCTQRHSHSSNSTSQSWSSNSETVLNTISNSMSHLKATTSHATTQFKEYMLKQKGANPHEPAPSVDYIQQRNDRKASIAGGVASLSNGLRSSFASIMSSTNSLSGFRGSVRDSSRGSRKDSSSIGTDGGRGGLETSSVSMSDIPYGGGNPMSSVGIAEDIADSVQRRRHCRNASRVPVAQKFEGDYFGETALVHRGTKRTAYVRAQTYVVSEKLTAHALNKLVRDKNPEAYEQIIFRISQFHGITAPTDQSSQSTEEWDPNNNSDCS